MVSRRHTWALDASGSLVLRLRELVQVGKPASDAKRLYALTDVTNGSGRRDHNGQVRLSSLVGIGVLAAFDLTTIGVLFKVRLGL